MIKKGLILIADDGRGLIPLWTPDTTFYTGETRWVAVSVPNGTADDATQLLSDVRKQALPSVSKSRLTRLSTASAASAATDCGSLTAVIRPHLPRRQHQALVRHRRCRATGEPDEPATGNLYEGDAPQNRQASTG